MNYMKQNKTSKYRSGFMNNENNPVFVNDI